MKFSLYIAKRYLFSKNRTNAINIITFIAMFGVIVGTSALFIVLSGFSGLRTFSDTLLEASDPDVKIVAAKGKTFLYSDVFATLHANDKIALFSGVIEERVFLKYKDRNHIAFIKGVEGNYNQVIAIDSALSVGEWLDKDLKSAAVIGSGISQKLSLSAYNYGEFLQVFVPKPGKGYINTNNAFHTVNTQVIAVYSGSEEFQNKYVFTNIALARELLKYTDDTITAIEIKVKEGVTNDAVQQELQKALGDAYVVKTKEQWNAVYYKVVNTENFISYLIFALIVVIALFNVIGSIIMMIIDKRKNLKTLLHLGCELKQIKKIFIYQGFLLAMVGMGIGLFLGLVLVFGQYYFSWFMISDTLAYPVEFRWLNLLLVIATITGLGYLASLVASSRISKEFINK